MVSRLLIVVGKSPLTWLKWSCLALAIGSMVLAVVFMLTAKQSIQHMVDVVAMSAGSSIKHLDMSEYDGDKLVWHLLADSAVEEGDQVQLRVPALDLYTDEGEVMPIRALSGVYAKETQLMRFAGDVQLDYMQWTLTSQTLLFDEKNDQVHVPEDFVLWGEDMQMIGRDMKVWRATGNIKVDGGVRMTLEGL